MLYKVIPESSKDWGNILVLETQRFQKESENIKCLKLASSHNIRQSLLAEASTWGADSVYWLYEKGHFP